MRKFTSRLRGIVWPAVVAAITGLVSVVVAIAGASVQVVLGLSLFGLTMAILTPVEGR